MKGDFESQIDKMVYYVQESLRDVTIYGPSNIICKKKKKQRENSPPSLGKD